MTSHKPVTAFKSHKLLPGKHSFCFSRKIFLNTITSSSTQSQAQAKTQSQAQAEAQAAAGTISSFVIIYDESQLIWQLTWS